MRLFLAIEIPEEARRELRAAQDRLRAVSPGWRWVRAGGIHLTLRFLGEVSEDTDERIRGLWRRAVEPVAPFDLRLGGVGRFPPAAARPRVLWVGAHEPDGGERLLELASRVEDAAREAGFEPETRGFRPHLTLARAGRGGRPVWHDDPGPAPRAAWHVDRVVLFRSELHPAGARYTALAEFPLGGAREGR